MRVLCSCLSDVDGGTQVESVLFLHPRYSVIPTFDSIVANVLLASCSWATDASSNR